MPKPNEQTQIDFIVDCLRKGEQRKTILGKFGKRWESVSRTTFDRRLNEAKAILQRENKHIQASAKQEVAKEVEARKSKILTLVERQVILSEMALGTLETEMLMSTKDGIKKVKVKPTHSDRRAAIAELNKMCGDYVPIKTEASLELKEIPNLSVKFNLTPKVTGD